MVLIRSSRLTTARSVGASTIEGTPFRVSGCLAVLNEGPAEHFLFPYRTEPPTRWWLLYVNGSNQALRLRYVSGHSYKRIFHHFLPPTRRRTIAIPLTWSKTHHLSRHLHPPHTILKPNFLNYTQLHTIKTQDPTLDLKITHPQRPIYPPHHSNCNINIVITVSPPPPQAKTWTRPNLQIKMNGNK